MRIRKFTQLSACLAAMLTFPQLGLSQDAPDFTIDSEEVIAIIGGEESSIGRFPSMAALLRVSPTQDLFQRQFCAGTAISDSYILTAAHCMFGNFGQIDPDELLIAGNFIDLANDSPAEISVQQIFVHPSYDDAALLAEHDIAILQTSVPHNIPPVTLFNGNARSLTGVDALIAGWGITQQAQFSDIDDTFIPDIFPNVLNEASVPVTDFNTCNSVYGRQLSAPHVCAGFQQGGVDACQGDSGGPLMFSDGQKLIQIGVTSFGNGCALPDAYGVYSNVELYESFIDRIVPAHSNGQPLFDAPEEFMIETRDGEDDDDNGVLGFGSADRGMLLLLGLAATMRLRRSRKLTARVSVVAAAALLTTGCATGYPSVVAEEASSKTSSDASLVKTTSGQNGNQAIRQVSNRGGDQINALIRTSSAHKNLPMFDVAALSEKRASAMEAASARYGVEPVCEGKKVAPRNSRRADFYERCEYVGFAADFDGGTIESVTYHFMSNRLIQIDATLHGPAFVLSSMANTLDDILGESVFSVGETIPVEGGDALPQAVYHWSDAEIAFARLMTEAGADTESFLFTLQHPRITDSIAELPAL